MRGEGTDKTREPRPSSLADRQRFNENFGGISTPLDLHQKLQSDLSGLARADRLFLRPAKQRRTYQHSKHASIPTTDDTQAEGFE